MITWEVSKGGSTVIANIQVPSLTEDVSSAHRLVIYPNYQLWRWKCAPVDALRPEIGTGLAGSIADCAKQAEEWLQNRTDAAAANAAERKRIREEAAANNQRIRDEISNFMEAQPDVRKTPGLRRR